MRWTEAHVVELQAEVEALVRARDLSVNAYQAGAITLTDVLDADRQLLTARDALDDNQAGAASWDVPPHTSVADSALGRPPQE
jgi:outer membrane protein TolC